MTPHTKKTVRNVGVITASVLAIGGWAVRTGADAVDHRYVHADTFALYRIDQERIHQRDSLIHDAREARIDTSLSYLLRACQRRRECP